MPIIIDNSQTDRGWNTSIGNNLILGHSTFSLNFLIFKVKSISHMNVVKQPNFKNIIVEVVHYYILGIQ